MTQREFERKIQKLHNGQARAISYEKRYVGKKWVITAVHAHSNHFLFPPCTMVFGPDALAALAQHHADILARSEKNETSH
jgi:hypothetical protein